VIVFPNAKINLGLNILRKRNDGFHDLETIFYPVLLHDALEIIRSPQKEPLVSITTSGIPIPLKGNNLCEQAYSLLKKKFDLPPVQIHLHKKIPIGAGLGGGSANAAFTLRLLNEKFSLNIPDTGLMELALELGSDCPFFILNKPCIAQGRGEQLVPIELDVSGYRLVLVNPRIHIDTAWAFSQVTPRDHNSQLSDIIREPVSEWRHKLVNDFQKPIFVHYPLLAGIANQLYESGALFASMTGTGSTIFAFFQKAASPVLDFPEHYFVHWVNGPV
jgi:4-diphosphocytidyl-2-C-methyl-D-erythritol kinase